MGSLCSKSSNISGGDHVLRPINTNSNRGFQSLASPATERPDPRIAAAQAAEQRLKAVRLTFRARRAHSNNFHIVLLHNLGSS